MKINADVKYIPYHCRSCGYEHEIENVVCSYPRLCPSCGQASVSLGYKRLPTNNVHRDKEPMSYNWADASDKRIQVYFTSFDGKRFNFTIDPEYAENVDSEDSAIEQAKSFLAIVKKKYWYFGKEKELESFITHMESFETESRLNSLINKEKEIREQLVALFRDWENTKYEIEEIKECQQSLQQ